MIRLLSIVNQQAVIAWNLEKETVLSRIYWSDRETDLKNYRLMGEAFAEGEARFVLKKSTHVPHRLLVCQLGTEGNVIKKESYITPVHFVMEEQLEKLDRGLVAVKTEEGVFLSWRLFLTEAVGYDQENRGMTGMDFSVYRDGAWIGKVSRSTNYLDRDGTFFSAYCVAPCINGKEYAPCAAVRVWNKDYLDIPLQKPDSGVTPSGEAYTYSANDMSVADVDGDGEYEFIVKWDPSNSHDVSIKGYTGRCYLDCYKRSGKILWRLDMGPNIRAGAHYTQFMCYDFNGDGRAEMAVKTAPGTSMTLYGEDGKEKETFFITMLKEDEKKGYSHRDSYAANALDYRNHLIEVFSSWQEHPEVTAGHWPGTLEECFHMEKTYPYPLSCENAERLVDFFLDEYAPAKSPKNRLRELEGFIWKGPEYLTMFGGDGRELQTISFPFERVDDGLMWGDYAMDRIEPCNRVDRFLSAVAYLDGKNPYLIVCRGYYTRAAVAAYRFENRWEQIWSADSGFVPMKNPFDDDPHDGTGTDPVYGELAGQGNHSVSAFDVDGDGFMEIIYGAACLDHDGSLLYSSKDKLPDGTIAKLGHGDAMHVADIDPKRPGCEIFNVFEGADHAPYGYALRDGETGNVIFGKYANEDLGRCMVGDVLPKVEGLQCWINGVGIYDCHGNLLEKETPGTNMSIRWAGDLSTQITDGPDYLNQESTGVIQDWTHGSLLIPQGTLTNNGTKGNPCLIADIFGDFREEILLRTKDSLAIRIYTNTGLTGHKLFTLMHDSHYRCSVAWQNNCYNQPGYPGFYYGSDMEFDRVLPYMKRKPVIYFAGDSIAQTCKEEERPRSGLGESLLKYLDRENCIRIYPREDCPFKQEMRYESRHLIVDNCAMAGRSSKTFLEDGRLWDMKEHMKEGDYLLIQFGHNDGAVSKPERYVSVLEFAVYLEKYIKAAREKGVIPILLSSVCLCPWDEKREEEAKKIEAVLPEYSCQMKAVAEKEGVLFVDMYRLTLDFCEKVGQKEAESIYIWDKVHLSEKGADCYAEILANHIRRFIIEGETEEMIYGKASL